MRLFHVFNALVDFAVPPVCPICEQPLRLADHDRPACVACAARIPWVENYCSRCSAPLGPYLRSEDGCQHCRDDRFAFEATIALGEYRDSLRDAILRAKNRGGEPAAAWLADRFWEHRRPELERLTIDVVTAVPQHWRRRTLGPHNTAELLGRRLARRLKTPFRASILVKTRWTPSQTTLTRTDRRNNLRSAFRGSRDCSEGRILLVDDVMTTGTTAHRAARALRDAGARGVWVAVIARGLGH